MKASVAYKTLDNITVVLLAFKNFKTALSNEFIQVNGMMQAPTDSKWIVLIYQINHLSLISFKLVWMYFRQIIRFSFSKKLLVLMNKIFKFVF